MSATGNVFATLEYVLCISICKSEEQLTINDVNIIQGYTCVSSRCIALELRFQGQMRVSTCCHKHQTRAERCAHARATVRERPRALAVGPAGRCAAQIHFG